MKNEQQIEIKNGKDIGNKNFAALLAPAPTPPLFYTNY